MNCYGRYKRRETESDKAKQEAIKHSLPARIEVGFSTIGFDSDKGKKLLRALLSFINPPATEPQPEPAHATMREELQKIAAKRAADAPVPERSDVTPEEKKVLDSLNLIEFGTWFEFKGGKRLKVAWSNSRTSHYMLVNQLGRREQMISGIDLARKMLAREARVISGSSKPFFERALENIFEKLNEKAHTEETAAP